MPAEAIAALPGFSRHREQSRYVIHAAAHSHHPWPDVSFDAQCDAWTDAAKLLDQKWDHIFEKVIPAAQKHIARQLNLPDPASIAFGPNTHSFVLRILSCLPHDRPLRILTTSSEFMSFFRQISRLEEDRLATVVRVPTHPFESFVDRFIEAETKDAFDLIYLSHVFFDSGFALRDPAKIIATFKRPEPIVVIDGYHGFMAIPTDFSAAAQRAFYLAGGYKYAMAGEGACFLHAPPGYGARPVDTGWYAGFSALESGEQKVGYANDGSRFLGATFDVSGIYRFNAVQEWLASDRRTVEDMLHHVRKLEEQFLDALDKTVAPLNSTKLVVGPHLDRGRFLAFRTADAGRIAAALARENILVDHRTDRLRVGFGIYHSGDDAIRLARALERLNQA
jgi:selenocysteine lyase/cysteine desulfurase